MVELGYSLASEEHGPKALIRQAPMAEEIGFPFALISDHFYLWLDQQGQAPFVWATLGTIAQATERLKLGRESPVRWSGRTQRSLPWQRPFAP